MPNVKKIVVGVDLHQGDRLVSSNFNEMTNAVISQAITIAQGSGASLTIATVLQLSEEAVSLIKHDLQNLKRTVEDIALDAVNKLAAQAQAAGLSATGVVLLGDAAEELVRLAASEHADLMFVGTRQRSTVVRTLFGSTAQKLVKLAPCPVWICKPGEVREVKEIVVASDFSEVSTQALQWAVDLSRGIDAKVFLVHAAEYPLEAYLATAGVDCEEVKAYRTKVNEEATVALNKQLQQTDYRTTPYGVLIEIVDGAPDEVIPAFVEKCKADLVIMGTHGRTGLEGLFLGNTAERVLTQVHASMLAVKPAPERKPIS